MKNAIKKIFGMNSAPLRKSEFSRFIYDSSPTRKRRLIEEVVKDANRDQRDLVDRVERRRSAK